MTSTTIARAGVRDDLVAAHTDWIASLAAAGACWSGAEKVALAGEVRRAMQNSEIPPWEAPSTIEGLIDADSPLPQAAVDAVWRITNHPGTLTKEWYQAIVAELPSPLHYVELVSVVAPQNAVDRLAEILDLDRLPLPGPVDADPTGDFAEDIAVTTHWVPTANADGANVLKALSALPNGNRGCMVLSDAQYVPADTLLGDMDWNRGTLDRRQIELVAAQTSLLNDCFY